MIAYRFSLFLNVKRSRETRIRLETIILFNTFIYFLIAFFTTTLNYNITIKISDDCRFMRWKNIGKCPQWVCALFALDSRTYTEGSIWVKEIRWNELHPKKNYRIKRTMISGWPIFHFVWRLWSWVRVRIFEVLLTA